MYSVHGKISVSFSIISFIPTYFLKMLEAIPQLIGFYYSIATGTVINSNLLYFLIMSIIKILTAGFMLIQHQYHYSMTISLFVAEEFLFVITIVHISKYILGVLFKFNHWILVLCFVIELFIYF